MRSLTGFPPCSKEDERETQQGPGKRGVCAGRRSAIHDRLVYIIRGFPEFEKIPPFYREMAEILYGVDNIKQSLGAVGWAAKHTKMVGHEIAIQSRRSTETLVLRKRAVARLASMVHQIDKDLLFLNKVRNTLRKLPHVEDAFTVVIAGYPNVGKSSFIRVCFIGDTRDRVLPIHDKRRDRRAPGAGTGPDPVRGYAGDPDRPADQRNPIERQALSAIMNVASVILFILDPSEHCGYPMEMQLRLLDEVKGMVNVPLVVVANKSDLRCRKASVPCPPRPKTG